jgi:murein DD-endopeptidase MepM/ murein hydrolase activator NlpD
LGSLNIVRAFSLATLISLLGACSSLPPVETERKGLLDHISEHDASGRDISELPGSPSLGESEAEIATSSKFALGEWRWPLEMVTITSKFGKRGKRVHEGVDLRAKIKTPVYAVDDAEVYFSGRKVRGYGTMVILKHPNSMFTVYAHLSKALVKQGDILKKGQQVALSGKTGRVRGGAHLHFEVRQGLVALDPQKVLPTTNVAFLPAPEAVHADEIAEEDLAVPAKTPFQSNKIVKRKISSEVQSF